MSNPAIQTNDDLLSAERLTRIRKADCMQTKPLERLDDLLPDDDPGPIPRPVAIGSRLGIAAEDLVDEFRRAVIGFDTGNFSEAANAVRRLRLWNLHLKYTPPPKPPARIRVASDLFREGERLS